MSNPTNKTDRNTTALNRAVDKAFRAMADCRDKAALLGSPIRGLSLRVDDEGDTHCRVSYFKVPKQKRTIDRLRK